MGPCAEETEAWAFRDFWERSTNVHFRKKVRIFRNNLRALRNYQEKQTTISSLPSYLFIEPTNHCNLRCIMCPTGAGKVHVERGFMDLGLFCRIIDEVHPYVSTVILAMGGESLLHPDLARMASYAERHEVKAALNTNATLLDSRKAEELLDSGISYLSFAFDGFTKAAYEKARRGADFDKTLENILNFLRMKQERGQKKPYTVLSMLDLGLEESGKNEKKAFLRRFDGLVDDIHLREVNSWGSMFKGSETFRHRMFDGAPVPCGRLWNTLGITWNGEVVPCIYQVNHDYVAGHIMRNSLAEIWNSDKYVALRQAMLQGRHLEISPICDNCTIAGTPKMFGIPAGLRICLADALYNVFGYGLEKRMVGLANMMRRGNFASRRMM